MHPLNAYRSMASSAVREPIGGPMLEVWHGGDGPAAHWRVLLGGGDAVDGARDGCCVLCDEQRPMSHHEARSEVLPATCSMLRCARQADGRPATTFGVILVRGARVGCMRYDCGSCSTGHRYGRSMLCECVRLDHQQCRRRRCGPVYLLLPCTLRIRRYFRHRLRSVAVF